MDLKSLLKCGFFCSVISLLVQSAISCYITACRTEYLGKRGNQSPRYLSVSEPLLSSGAEPLVGVLIIISVLVSNLYSDRGYKDIWSILNMIHPYDIQCFLNFSISLVAFHAVFLWRFQDNFVESTKTVWLTLSLPALLYNRLALPLWSVLLLPHCLHTLTDLLAYKQCWKYYIFLTKLSGPCPLALSLPVTSSNAIVL